MNKAVLISIRPKWCELIASGQKTVEVRKTKPKLETPFKCYIYCTKPSFPHEDFLVFDAGTNKVKAFYGGGKVIGECVCNRIELLDYDSIGLFVWDADGKNGKYLYEIGENACLTRTEVIQYTGVNRPYGWFISDLVIYDKPKELSKFQRACNHKEDCCTCKRWNIKNFQCIAGITRPPQSWCYVEETE